VCWRGRALLPGGLRDSKSSAPVPFARHGVIPPDRPSREVHSLFESLALSPDPVFVTDRHNRIVFWNRSAERMLGYTAEETAGVSCAGMLEGCDTHGNRYCSDSCPVTQMGTRGEPVHEFGLRVRAKDGRILLVAISILNFAVSPPDGFLLAHILKPALIAGAATHAEHPETPPRSALVAVRESPDARARKLTAREVDVLGMLAAGHPTPEIGSRLHISTLTARNHIQNILDKLEVHSKAEAVAFAFQKRLI
jgi:PAS domain S-box-containing protein